MSKNIDENIGWMDETSIGLCNTDKHLLSLWTYGVPARKWTYPEKYRIFFGGPPQNELCVNYPKLDNGTFWNILKPWDGIGNPVFDIFRHGHLFGLWFEFICAKFQVRWMYTQQAWLSILTCMSTGNIAQQRWKTRLNLVGIHYII